MTAGERLKQMTVLFAEDEYLPRKSIANFLKRQVGKLEVAENGRQGLALFMAHRPGIVITDLEMPEMNGMEMVRAIREMETSVPIIITTGYDDDEHRCELADRILIKPVVFGKLLETIEECVAERYGPE
ncbi:MAG TPA: response regulator [Desulfuromonadaceae bacterium]